MVFGHFIVDGDATITGNMGNIKVENITSTGNIKSDGWIYENIYQKNLDNNVINILSNPGYYLCHSKNQDNSSTTHQIKLSKTNVVPGTKITIKNANKYAPLVIVGESNDCVITDNLTDATVTVGIGPKDSMDFIYYGEITLDQSSLFGLWVSSRTSLQIN